MTYFSLFLYKHLTIYCSSDLKSLCIFGRVKERADWAETDALFWYFVQFFNYFKRNDLCEKIKNYSNALDVSQNLFISLMLFLANFVSKSADFRSRLIWDMSRLKLVRFPGIFWLFCNFWKTHLTSPIFSRLNSTWIIAELRQLIECIPKQPIQTHGQKNLRIGSSLG